MMHVGFLKKKKKLDKIYGLGFKMLQLLLLPDSMNESNI